MQRVQKRPISVGTNLRKITKCTNDSGCHLTSRKICVRDDRGHNAKIEEGLSLGSNAANPVIFYHREPTALATELQPLRVRNGLIVRNAVVLGKSYKANSFGSK
jgi:hypothetical protein